MDLLDLSKAELNSAILNLERVGAEKASALSKIKPTPSQLYKATHSRPNPFHEPFLLYLISLGLCFVLFLGTNELIGINLKNARWDDVYILFFSFAISFLVALGTKKIMTIVAKLAYSHERLAPQQRNIAWWKQISSGSSPFYLGLSFIALETCFGLPGLLGLLPPMLATNPLYILATLAGASFFATANVCLGYYTGVEQGIAEAKMAEYDRESYAIEMSDAEQECIRSNQIYQETIDRCDDNIRHLTLRIKELRYQIEKLEWARRKEPPTGDANLPRTQLETPADRNGKVDLNPVDLADRR
jgi:hypothetical protein